MIDPSFRRIKSLSEKASKTRNRDTGLAFDKAAETQPTERDPLLPQVKSHIVSAKESTHALASNDRTAGKLRHGTIRSRYAAANSSRSPPVQRHHLHQQQLKKQQTYYPPMEHENNTQSWHNVRPQVPNQQLNRPPSLSGVKNTSTIESNETSYDNYNDQVLSESSSSQSLPQRRVSLSDHRVTRLQMNPRAFDQRQQYYNERATCLLRDDSTRGENPTLPPVPEEIYAVRRAALTILHPLTYTWLIFLIGISLSVTLGMSHLMQILPNIPIWLIFTPCWISHTCLLLCHVLSARALSTFITEANENRQRQDTTDHLDRTEYLPLLQKALKFGLKTGLLSFCIFIFEILLYLRFSRHTISLSIALVPIWILVVGGILDGIICKTQHIIRILCWILVFVNMVLIVIKVDYNMAISWNIVLTPIIALLSIFCVTLIYIVYGHQVGYFRLSEAQLTSGILYSTAAFLCIVLVVMLGEIIPPDEFLSLDKKVFVVILAPLIVFLIGVGAWGVSRDEFERLLQFGGQATIHAMKLRLERNGWTSVESRGVSEIPMFGEVSYEPLGSKKTESLELCVCCACYPFEEEDEPLQYSEPNVAGFPAIPAGSSQC